MLKIAKKFFDDNGIKYSIGFVTLLGTVRHKGFIPWDDYIDLIIPRNDYEKIKKIAKTEKSITCIPRDG